MRRRCRGEDARLVLKPFLRQSIELLQEFVYVTQVFGCEIRLWKWRLGQVPAVGCERLSAGAQVLACANEFARLILPFLDLRENRHHVPGRGEQELGFLRQDPENAGVGQPQDNRRHQDDALESEDAGNHLAGRGKEAYQGGDSRRPLCEREVDDRCARPRLRSHDEQGSQPSAPRFE